MKFVLFWEITGIPPSLEESGKTEKTREDEKKYGKTLFQPHFYDSNNGISIVEIDNIQQLANRRALAHPTTIKAMPLVLGNLSRESMIEHGKIR